MVQDRREEERRGEKEMPQSGLPACVFVASGVGSSWPPLPGQLAA
jgi:hypothetical protein